MPKKPSLQCSVGGHVERHFEEERKHKGKYHMKKSTSAFREPRSLEVKTECYEHLVGDFSTVILGTLPAGILTGEKMSQPRLSL